MRARRVRAAAHVEGGRETDVAPVPPRAAACLAGATAATLPPANMLKSGLEVRVALWLSKLSNMNCWEGDMNWLAQGRVTL